MWFIKFSRKQKSLNRHLKSLNTSADMGKMQLDKSANASKRYIFNASDGLNVLYKKELVPTSTKSTKMTNNFMSTYSNTTNERKDKVGGKRSKSKVIRKFEVNPAYKNIFGKSESDNGKVFSIFSSQ